MTIKIESQALYIWCDCIRANFQNFNILKFLLAFGFDYLDSAKMPFSTTIDHLSQGKSSPVSRWAREIKKKKKVNIQ
jgi:hypothetical protein